MANNLIADLLQSPSAARAALEEQLQLKGALAAKPFTGASNSANPISGAMNRLAASQLQQSPLQMQQMVRNLGGGLGSIASALGAPQAGDALRRGGMSPKEQESEAIAKAAQGIARTPEGLRQFANRLRQMNRPDLAERMDDKADELMLKQRKLDIEQRKLDIEEKEASTIGADTTTIKDIYNYAYNELGVNLSDPNLTPEARKIAYSESRNAVREMKRAGTEETFRIGNVENLNDYQKEVLRPKAQEARVVIGQSKRMNRLLDQIDTGSFEKIKLSARKALAAFGISDEETEELVANQEAFESQAFKRIMSYVQQTKGAISNREMQLFGEAETGLTKSKKGNRLILKIAEETAKMQVKLMKHLTQWRNDPKNKGKGEIEWQAEEDRWLDEQYTKMFSAEDIKTIREAMEEPVATPFETPKASEMGKSANAPELVQSDEEAQAMLPVGAYYMTPDGAIKRLIEVE
jgi:hypothetical protein